MVGAARRQRAEPGQLAARAAGGGLAERARPAGPARPAAADARDQCADASAPSSSATSRRRIRGSCRTRSAAVLDAGVQAGVFTSGEEYYGEIKRIVDQRAPAGPQGCARARQRKRAAPPTAPPRRTRATCSSRSARGPRPRRCTRWRCRRAAIDRDRTLTRLGIAQAQQGKNAEARATFAAGRRRPRPGGADVDRLRREPRLSAARGRRRD